jgi:hypothetical protein
MVRQIDLAKLEAREMQRSAEPVWLNPVRRDLPPPGRTRGAEGAAFRQRIEADLPPVMGNQDVYMVLKNLSTMPSSSPVGQCPGNGPLYRSVNEISDDGTASPPRI